MKRLLTATSVAAMAFVPRLAAAQATMPLFLGNVTLQDIVGRIVKVLLTMSGSLALVMIIVGGLRWMTAQGEADKIKKAKGTLTWAIIGLIVAFSAYSLVDFILKNL